MIRKLLKFAAILLAAVIALAAVALAVFTVAEYRPKDVEAVSPIGTAAGELHAGDTVRVLTWNLGYGALGDNADFFMDGGTMVQTADEARVRRNMVDIREFVASDAPDLLFLQETDLNSDRSHHIDERAELAAAMPGYTSLFAYNYNALYVPYPLPPIGHVESGLLTFSRYFVSEGSRIQLPCPFSWPVRLVNLKRCLLVSRIPVEGSDKELVAVNLHLEAYDDGSGKIAQSVMLASFLKSELDKGNYVIVGGDFNQVFSNADLDRWTVKEGLWAPGVIYAEESDERLSLLMDGTVPTCRSLDRVLAGADRANFQYYLIDGFMVSDNLRVEKLETVQLDFVATDHNPVRLDVTLLNE